MKNWLMIWALLSLFSCKQQNTLVNVYPSFVDPSKENVWGGDVRLFITNITKTNNSNLYTLKSVYKNDTLGFQISIPFYEDKSGFGESVKIINLGKLSRNFKNALGIVYKVKVDTTKDFPDTIKASFVDLDAFVLNKIGKEPTDKDSFRKYKLFFEDSGASDEGEAEIFINVSETNKTVKLVEKDHEYRKALIGFFTN